ncbi:sel1 repeat family protein [Neisseria flavescens]|uniref:Tetratricopeptide repeat protein n=1 Tax=Neisseria flavescens NRL30031/H210 TaxID=546264 RepID=C0ELX8_NEIFL|nr:tetratricopeptide repeat protein [Neisseria flavescens]SPY01016.1 tol-pal system protein YbgF [Neisseria meningitidis]VTX93748.1 TPR repeat protein [Neisseria subflava]EEG33982.1 tetratricopeptide repeat protein [Neisseria flavescens NRL30031/H210]QCL69415.1 sel1 repeat family protein [Neisseria flavescens]SPY05834.1 tol-pal system protein YbgF [Neisseria meningitidis]
MNVQDLINEGIELFENKEFDEAIAKLNQALDGIEDKNSKIQEQNNAQFWLGRCYLEQAMKAKDKESEQLFEQAVEHFQRSLEFAEQLENKQNSIQQQIYAQSWLGRCYFEQAMQAEGENSERLFEQAVKHRKERLRLAEQLKGENGTQEQIFARYWLGRCYLEQAMKAEGSDSERLFEHAMEQFQERLRLAEQLKGKNGTQKQINAKYWLGHCYFEQAMRVREEKFKEAIESFEEALELSENLPPSGNKQNNKKRIYLYLRKIYLHQEKWEEYFKWKKQEIQEKLFENNGEGLTSAVSTILAVLNISPIELGSTPLAHYTSPSVCEKLFGIIHDKNDVNNKGKDPVDKQKANPMRIGSSTYMNDPTEGEGLLELLNLQDLELENKADCPDYNAFFTCFSSRVNDLNQFRLYGKENSVEASGCCLVFNKKVRWLKGSNVLESFRRLTDKSDEAPETSAEVSDILAVNLPLYQVAYIAYKDEYIAEEKCRIWLPNKDNPNFGIRLKSFGNKGWHEYRIGKLEEALKQLIRIFKGKANISDEDRKALEYIRYLFKDFAFRDEEEFRLLKIEQIGSKDIKYCQDTKSVYLPYADIRDIVDEVILGTNYEKSGKERKAEVFQHLMRKHYPNVKVSRSSLPINANPPIKKD